MAEKLSWTELRRALAARSGISEKEANTFLTALNAQLIEALQKDKQVRINGLGTFRLQEVAPRKSVNIISGEEMTIERYNKIAFSPEASVKELIENTPIKRKSATSSGTEVNPLQKLGEQADEIVDILADLGQSPKEKKEPKKTKKQTTKKKVASTKVKKEQPADSQLPEEKPVDEPAAVDNTLAVEEQANSEKTIIVPPVVIEVPATEEPTVTEETPVVETPVQQEETVIVPPVVVETPTTEEPKQTEIPVFIPSAEPEEKPKKKKKKFHFWRDTLICVIILLILLLVGYFFFLEQITGWINSLGIKSNTQTEKVADKTGQKDNDQASSTTEETISFTDEASERTISAEEDILNGEETPEFVPQEVVYESFITTELMHQDSRLAWMAKRYYGDKAYWPYLYDANKDHIKNPNKVVTGTPVRVPRLTQEQKDTTIENTRLTLQYLREVGVAAIQE